MLHGEAQCAVDPEQDFRQRARLPDGGVLHSATGGATEAAEAASWQRRSTSSKEGVTRGIHSWEQVLQPQQPPAAPHAQAPKRRLWRWRQDHHHHGTPDARPIAEPSDEHAQPWEDVQVPPPQLMELLPEEEAQQQMGAKN